MLSTNARREEIYHPCRDHQPGVREELWARFEVTGSSIPRHLALLNGQGRLARTYGGAMALGAHPEASLRQRTCEAFEQKHAIARWAASVIVPGENILLEDLRRKRLTRPMRTTLRPGPTDTLANQPHTVFLNALLAVPRAAGPVASF